MGKILIYTLTEGKGGVEEYVLNLSRFREQPSDKYGYIVLGRDTVYREEMDSLGVDYFFVPKKKHLISNINALNQIFANNRNQYDTVYFNTSGLYYPFPYVLAAKYKYRIVLHSHSSNGVWPKKIIHLFNRSWISRLVDVRLSCSKYAGDWMFGKKKYTLIPNSIDIERFKFNVENRKVLRNRYDIDNKIVIGTIGRLHKGKNQSFIVEILSELIKCEKNAVFLLVGEGEMKKPILEKAKEYGVEDKVIFVGQSNNPEFYYSAMDYFLLPSFMEGFPITLIEAQANGIPCIVSDTVTNETNISGKLKFLSIKDEPQEWARYMIEHAERYDCLDCLYEKGFDVHLLWKIVDHYV